MVKFLSYYFATVISIMTVVYPLLSNAQPSKHAALWRISNYCLDFTSNPPTFYPYDLGDISINNPRTVWYVDSDGEVALIAPYDEGKMIIRNKETKQFEIISSDFQFAEGFFVPMPNNDNQVFYFEQNRFFLIDLKQKTVNLKGENIKMSRISHVAVQHTDCNKVWLINTDQKVWTTYLLTSENLNIVNETVLKSSDYTCPTIENDYWEVNLSQDCEHYTMITFENYNTEVYYGDFDRETGTFMNKSRYNFGNEYVGILNSIIAPDNSRIYYVCASTQADLNIIEVPIIEGKPDYSKRKTIYAEHKFGALFYRQIAYGLDNKIYFLDFKYRKISTIEINNKNETVYTNNVFNIPNEPVALRCNYFVSTWFMDNPCQQKPCATIPKTPTIIEKK